MIHWYLVAVMTSTINPKWVSYNFLIDLPKDLCQYIEMQDKLAPTYITDVAGYQAVMTLECAENYERYQNVINTRRISAGWW
jgi:hypothetical protein